MPPFSWTFRVRYNECDPQGIVFNANYLTYFDMTMTELLREAFGAYGDMVAEHGVDIVVGEAMVRYRDSARFDDMLQTQAAVVRLGTTGMTTAIAVRRDGLTLVDGELRHVFVDRDSLERTPIPDAVRARLEPFSAPAPSD